MAAHVEQEMNTVPEHLCSPMVFSDVLLARSLVTFLSLYERFEDTKEVIRSRKSIHRKYRGQNKKIVTITSHFLKFQAQAAIKTLISSPTRLCWCKGSARCTHHLA
jgi:hypothetical protein